MFSKLIKGHIGQGVVYVYNSCDRPNNYHLQRSYHEPSLYSGSYAINNHELGNFVVWVPLLHPFSRCFTMDCSEAGCFNAASPQTSVKPSSRLCVMQTCGQFRMHCLDSLSFSSAFPGPPYFGLSGLTPQYNFSPIAFASSSAFEEIWAKTGKKIFFWIK